MKHRVMIAKLKKILKKFSFSYFRLMLFLAYYYYYYFVMMISITLNERNEYYEHI